MRNAAQKNIHIPLTENLYRMLKQESVRTHQPISQLARVALFQWLKQQQKLILQQEISQYASACANKTDLDEALEAASVEHLFNEEKNT